MHFYIRIINMKYLITAMFITQFLAILSFKPDFQLAPNVTNCALILPVETGTQTLFIDIDLNSDPELKTCLLKNSHSEQSIVLLNMYSTDFRHVPIKVNATNQYIKTTDTPNIIIITTYLTPAMVESPLLKLFLQSHWSLLYIVVTGDKKFKCDNGVMTSTDFIMLEKIMNILWHRHKIMHVGVAFPFACKQKLIVYNGKRPSNQFLYDRSIQIINMENYRDVYCAVVRSRDLLTDQYPLRGSIFYRYPTAIKECKNIHYYQQYNLNLTAGFCGLDGMVMHDILTYFKFNLSLPEDEKCTNYGYVSPGNVTGSLGCIIRKELDISFNSRFMTLYANERILYLHYVSTDSLCALLKNAGVIPIWLGAFNVYRGELWLLIITVVTTIGVIMWVSAIISSKITGGKTGIFWFYLHDALMTSMFGCSLRKKEKFQLLRGTCLFTSILFVAVYQSHINHVYTTHQRYESIETLEDLYKSNLTLYTSHAMNEFMKQLRNPNNHLQSDFIKRSRIFEGDKFALIIQDPGATTLERKTDVTMEILETYSDEAGRPLIEIVDECFSTYYLSYIATSGFPFFKDLKTFLERMKEAGLPTKYYKWTQRMLGLPDSMPEYRNEPRPFSKITLADQRVAFGMLLLGYAGSLIIFLVEMCSARGHRLRMFKRRIS